MRLSSLIITGLTMVIPYAAVAQQPATNADGKKLFEEYGCTNCHGPDGIHPTSKHVPVLKGKSTAYLYDNAITIFGDDRADRKMHAMHDQFCIGEEPEEGCYPKPSSDDLLAISTWLGSSSLPEKKQTPQELYVTSAEAYEKLMALGDKALFVDVRTRAEVAFLGMPENANANIPFMTLGDFSAWDDKKGNYKLRPNSRFVASVGELLESRNLTKESPIFLMCRSGSRSAKAAKMLSLVGYTNVYNITEGYEGDKAKDRPRKGERVVNCWKNSGLPWSYRLSRDEMYWE